MEQLEIMYQLDDGGFEPEKAHDTDAGFDIRTPEFLIVKAHNSVFVDSKVRVFIPKGYVGMLKSKSGLNVKKGIVSEGVIDADYTGTIGIKLYNHSDKDVCFDVGDKITQLVFLPIPDVVLIPGIVVGKEIARGDNGFGSTGR